MVFITLFAIYLPQPLTPNYLQNQQFYSRTMIGILGAFGSLGSAIAMLTLSNLHPYFGFFVSQIWLVLFASIFLNAKTTFAFGLGYFFIGGYRLCRAMVLTISRSLIHPEETGLAYGLVETANSLAVILAPILAGALYRLDPHSVYQIALYLLSVVFILNLILFLAIKKRKVQAQ